MASRLAQFDPVSQTVVHLLALQQKTHDERGKMTFIPGTYQVINPQEIKPGERINVQKASENAQLIQVPNLSGTFMIAGMSGAGKTVIAANFMEVVHQDKILTAPHLPPRTDEELETVAKEFNPLNDHAPKYPLYFVMSSKFEDSVLTNLREKGIKVIQLHMDNRYTNQATLVRETIDRIRLYVVKAGSEEAMEELPNHIRIGC